MFVSGKLTAIQVDRIRYTLRRTQLLKKMTVYTRRHWLSFMCYLSSAPYRFIKNASWDLSPRFAYKQSCRKWCASSQL